MSAVATPEPQVTPAPAAGRMRGLVVRGVFWKFLSQTFRQGSRLIVALILARLLTPHQFGVAAEAIVFSSLVLVFADMAFGAALIQRDEITEEDRSTAFWASVAIGVCFTAIGFALAGPIAGFYHEPQVKPLFQVLSFGFVVTSFGAIQESLMTRDMRFKQLETRLMIASLGGGAVGIAIALTGGGAWAVIAQAMTIMVLSTILVWTMSRWRPSLRFSRESLRSMWSFSGYIFGHRLLYYIHRNADNLLIGRFIGAAQLGAYAIAYNVVLVPFSRIAVPIQDVLFPAFARVQGDLRTVASGWIRATRMVAAVCVPALVGLAILAPEFVDVVLGPKWHSAAAVIQILAWVGILQTVQGLNTGVLQAVGRARAIFRYTVVFFVAHIAAFVIGLHWGIVGVAAGYAVSTTIIEPFYLVLTARAVAISPWRFLRALSGVAQATIGMGLIVLAARNQLFDAGVPSLGRLAACTLAGVLAYLPLCAWRAPEVAAEVRDLIRRRREPVPAAVGAEA